MLPQASSASPYPVAYVIARDVGQLLHTYRSVPRNLSEGKLPDRTKGSLPHSSISQVPDGMTSTTLGWLGWNSDWRFVAQQIMPMKVLNGKKYVPEWQIFIIPFSHQGVERLFEQELNDTLGPFLPKLLGEICGDLQMYLSGLAQGVCITQKLLTCLTVMWTFKYACTTEPEPAALPPISEVHRIERCSAEYRVIALSTSHTQQVKEK